MRGANMASMAISGATPSSATQALSTAKAAPAQTEATEKAPVALKADTVKLSLAAQVKMMHRAGQSPALIAATLGTNVAAVDGYLNIKVTAQAAATTASTAQATTTAQATPEASTASATAAQPATAEKG
jgi:hypothetical protein